jgi:hypothetical protein
MKTASGTNILQPIKELYFVVCRFLVTKLVARKAQNFETFVMQSVSIQLMVLIGVL